MAGFNDTSEPNPELARILGSGLGKDELAQKLAEYVRQADPKEGAKFDSEIDPYLEGQPGHQLVVVPNENGDFDVQGVQVDEGGESSLRVPASGFPTEKDAYDWIAQQANHRVSQARRQQIASERAGSQADSALPLRGYPGPNPGMMR